MFDKPTGNRIGKISLLQLSKRELEERQMNATRGGNVRCACICSCAGQCSCPNGGMQYVNIYESGPMILDNAGTSHSAVYYGGALYSGGY